MSGLTLTLDVVKPDVAPLRGAVSFKLTKLIKLNSWTSLNNVNKQVFQLINYLSGVGGWWVAGGIWK